MTWDPNTVVFAVLVAGMIAGIFTHHIASNWRLRRFAQETSRFALYEARDKLVDVVLDGHLDETDKGWACAYESVNYLLELKNSLTAVGLVWRVRQIHRRMTYDTIFRSRVENRRDAIHRTARENEKFRAAWDLVAGGLLSMVMLRSRWYHRVVILAWFGAKRIRQMSSQKLSEVFRAISNAFRRGGVYSRSLAELRLQDSLIEMGAVAC